MFRGGERGGGVCSALFVNSPIVSTSVAWSSWRRIFPSVFSCFPPPAVAPCRRCCRRCCRSCRRRTPCALSTTFRISPNGASYRRPTPGFASSSSCPISPSAACVPSPKTLILQILSSVAILCPSCPAFCQVISRHISTNHVPFSHLVLLLPTSAISDSFISQTLSMVAILCSWARNFFRL